MKTLLTAMLMLLSTLIFAQKVTPGAYLKKIGDYEVYANGEIFYRTISQAHYDSLKVTKKLKGTSETFTSPAQSFSESYTGYLVKFMVTSGTINKLVAVGVTDGSNDVKTKFGTLNKVASGWASSYAYFKKEGTQVNIGLGVGTALGIFNANIKEYELIKIIK